MLVGGDIMKTAEQRTRQEKKMLEFKRWLVKTILYSLFIIGLLSLMTWYSFNCGKGTTVKVIEHKVKQGENLTSIASKYSDDYVLKAVADIKKLNGMKESDLQVGQTLKIVIK